MKKMEALERERDELERSLPEDIKELQKLLLNKKSELEKLLREAVKNDLPAAIDALESLEEGKKTISVEQALLISKVLHRILASQLKESSQPLSRSGEIDCMLLLYRLLQINVILLCKSGLDRSGAVRAMADSQSKLERLFYETQLSKLGAATEANPAAARAEAQKQLFDLIVHMDERRNELFRMSSQLQQERWISALKDWEEGMALQDLREKLFSAIDCRFDAKEAQKMKHTHYYLELVLTHLLSTESEKTLNSTGIIGLKYQHGAGWINGMFANFHALDRWPSFIQVERKVIKLVGLSEGIMYNSLKITEIAIALIQRLSNLRGH